MAHGSTLMAHGQEKLAPGPPGLSASAKFLLALSLEPRALRHELWGMGHEPLTIESWSIIKREILDTSAFLHLFTSNVQSSKASKSNTCNFELSNLKKTCNDFRTHSFHIFDFSYSDISSMFEVVLHKIRGAKSNKSRTSDNFRICYWWVEDNINNRFGIVIT